MGVDPADREEIHRTIDQTFHLEEGKGMVNDISLAAQIKLHTYFAEQIEARRDNPRDDMMTSLVQAEVTTPEGTRRLSTSEAANFANLLVSAGTETTGRLIGWAGALLAAHPDQRAELAADPSLITNTVEETLRYEAPSPPRAASTPATSRSTAPRSPPDPRSCCSPAPPAATNASTPTPTATTSTAASTAMSPSDTARTSASAPHSPAWKHA